MQRNVGKSLSSLRYFRVRTFASVMSASNRLIKEHKPGDPPTNELLSYSLYVPTLLRQTISPEDPLLNDDYFGVNEMFKMKDLFDPRMHFGLKIGTLNPLMKQYLFGHRLDVCIFDLNKTAINLRLALNFLAHVTYREGIILFIANDRINMGTIEQFGRESGEFVHTRQWQKGIFTDSKNLFGGEIRLPDLVVMTKTQTAVFESHPVVIEVSLQKTAKFKRPNKLLIPTIALVDSNCEPNLITYPIPANDDSRQSVQLFMKLCKDVILKAKSMKNNDKENEN